MRTVDPNSPALIVATVLVSLLLAGVYFSPTIVAAITRSHNLLAVILVDVLLGWTVVGWIIAWVLVFAGGRGPGLPQPAQPLSWPVNPPGAHGLSPDGMFWWDGIAWRDTRVVAPPSAPRSADGYWWWDGFRWRPVPPPAPLG